MPKNERAEALTILERLEREGLKALNISTQDSFGVNYGKLSFIEVIE